jgi:hypothetical protein
LDVVCSKWYNENSLVEGKKSDVVEVVVGCAKLLGAQGLSCQP